MAETIARSRFAEKDAEEVARAYLSWYRRLRVGCVVAAVVIGAGTLAGIFALNSWTLYLLGLFVLICIGVFVRRRVSREFQTLVDIINVDCDVEKWRGVIERIREHDLRRRRSRELCECYLALADLEELRPADALARMDGLNFGRRSIMNVMLFQNRAVCANELGDDALRDASLAALRELTASYRSGSKRRALAERQLADVELSFKPREAWGAADEERARERCEAASSHRESVSWALLLAERALVMGDAAAARELLDESVLAPMTPRASQRRDNLLARCRQPL